MKLNFIIAYSLLILTSCRSTNSQVKNENPELIKRIDVFFEKYKKNATSDAIDFIFDSTKDVSPEQLKELKEKLSSINLTMGKFNGYEQITIQSTSPSFIYYSYLVKYDIKPVRFIFIFYKPDDQWKLYKFKYDDKIDTELEQSGEIYFLK